MPGDPVMTQQTPSLVTGQPSAAPLEMTGVPPMSIHGHMPQNPTFPEGNREMACAQHWP